VVKHTKDRNLFRFENNTKSSSEELPYNCAAANISLNCTGGTGARGTTGTTPSNKVTVDRRIIDMSEEHRPPLIFVTQEKKQCQSVLLLSFLRNPTRHSFM
jgi:hypothetical protein